MTTVRDDQSLSRLEVVVLARLSCAKPPSELELGEDIAKLGEPEEAAARAREVTGTVLPALRRRGLVNERRLTDKGSRALRTELGLDSTPSWARVRDAHLPALALRLRAGSSGATKAMKDAKSIAAAVLRAHFDASTTKKLNELTDAMIVDALGLPTGPVTIGRIRLHMLARHTGSGTTGSPAQLRARIAAKILSADAPSKRSMGQALGRRWTYQVTESFNGPPLEIQRSLPLQAPVSSPTEQKPVVISADTLLNLVREAIPQIGSDGRFGKEKVFVSAIWQRIERDNRLPDLSLDRFKRWLVTANRDQLLDLARADLVGAMDPRLVRESEIEDLGATFHFVVDRRVNGTGQGHHAR